MKGLFLAHHCHKVYREEAVGVKNYDYIYQIMIYMSVKFGTISWKIDILSIVEIKIDSKNSFAQMLLM